MKKMKKLIVINLLSGPSTGKSVLASKIFTKLKELHISTELVREFPKELTWENRSLALQNQIYVFANQHHQIKVLENQVKVAVIEGSLLNSLVYGDVSEELKSLIISEYNKMDNINFYLERNVPYQTEGRIQSLEESKEKDEQILEVLEVFDINYITINPIQENIIDDITNLIIGKLNQ